MIRLAFAFLLSLCVSAQAQLSGGVGGFPGPGTPAASSYVGPGDVFSTGVFGAYSCSEAYNAAGANTSTLACDLVDSTAPTTIICTLRFTSTGHVDLTAYCPGSVTPAATCAAATGGVCNISKAYDLSGNGRHVVQTTAANQPTLTFSSTPTGTLPAINCGTSATIFLASASNYTQAQPLTLSSVLIRTTGTTPGGAIGANANIYIGSAGANLAVASSNNGTLLTAAATDNQWYTLQGLLNGTGTSSAINVNGSDSTGSSGSTTGFSNNAIRVCRASGVQLFGLVAEAIIYASSSTSTDRNALSANARSAGRYNF